MYPSKFDYLAPESLEEALSVLAERGNDVKILAGGQSLIPMMKPPIGRPVHADGHQPDTWSRCSHSHRRSSRCSLGPGGATLAEIQRQGDSDGTNRRAGSAQRCRQL